MKLLLGYLPQGLRAAINLRPNSRSSRRFSPSAAAVLAAKPITGRAQYLGVSGPPSTVELAAPAPAIRLGPELPLKLIEAPDLGAVRSEIRLDPSG